MADVYCKSGAAGAANGTTWADAYTTLVAAMAGAGAGGTVWVSDAHAESQSGAMAVAGSSSPATPIKIYCVDDSAEPPTALATTATVTTTSTGAITFSGFAECYGISFIQGSGNASSTTLGFTNSSPLGWKLERCLLQLATTGTSAGISFGSTSSGIDDAVVEFVDSRLQFSAVGQSVGVRINLKMCAPSGVQPLVVGTIPTTLFTASNDAAGEVEIVGVDWSQLTSGKTLLALAQTSSARWTFRDCKLSTTGTLISNAPSGPGAGKIRFINCDSADTNYIRNEYHYGGTITQETSIVRSGGASDGTTSFSRKIVTNANVTTTFPVRSCEPIKFWNTTVGGTVTVTVPILTDNVTLDDDEAWIEVEYISATDRPLGAVVTDRVADVFATPAAQTTDSGSTWSGTGGFTSPVKQELSTSCTPGNVGWIRAYVCVAKASTTVYYDPLILASSARQIMDGEGIINEPPSGGGGSGGIRLAGHGGLAS